ncbi:hypothetical protein NVP1191O_49 [Vibrio phage 1.191.O._10N.286.52.B4]|nr:hypothetical protein NVP1191O_49 [Vibrio phage 1.191.O._10N.286.52.B4]
MKISDEIKRRYPQSMRDMCEQEYIKKQVKGGDVIYTFADRSTIELTPNQDDINEAQQ